MTAVNVEDIPKEMRSRPRDRRGYPVPFTATIMKDGTPDFRVVDTAKVLLAASKKLCGLSGKKLNRKHGIWFIGGPVSAFGPHNLYLDPPMNADNAIFALKTCPYLAMPKYAEKEFREKKGGFDGTIVSSAKVIKDRPEVFVAVQVKAWEVIRDGREVLFRARMPYDAVGFWCHGRTISHAEARSLSPKIPDLDILRMMSDGIFAAPDSLGNL